MSDVNQTLADLGITLPEAPTPAANYVPFVRSGNLVFVSGQVSMDANGLVRGKLGENMSVADAQKAARLCALNLLAQVSVACDGDLNRVARVVKLTGFVNATGDFNQHPQVINGASDLMAEVFGDAGKHARAAVGSSSLPLGVAVEVEGIFEITDKPQL
jgi:enamine deaminase RidA (YjgF/YER057c/UK114 family)